MRHTQSTNPFAQFRVGYLLRHALWLVLILLFAAGLSLSGEGRTRAAKNQSKPVAQNPSACTGQFFTDVCPGDWFYGHVMQMSDLNAISGYADGTFRPNNSIT